ncbi:hypothetical protein M9H77_18925 [Catharanthus roseus]|uniref:Uncharacterized protein n=1 Tax=Catharanthus roseus TaxID=4058 RepID=A0ACC0B8X9_CATRO|nr:hypothetical protein M9H77_18925 [Catharanthus roseus]
MNCRFYEVLFLQQAKVELVPILPKRSQGNGKLLEADVEEGYIVRKDSRIVHNALGTIARNAIRLPLNYPKWDDILSSIIDSIRKEDNTTFSEIAKDDVVEEDRNEVKEQIFKEFMGEGNHGYTLFHRKVANELLR